MTRKIVQVELEASTMRPYGIMEETTLSVLWPDMCSDRVYEVTYYNGPVINYAKDLNFASFIQACVARHAVICFYTPGGIVWGVLSDERYDEILNSYGYNEHTFKRTGNTA